MRPTEILSGEHRVIEQVLSCLERIANRAATEETLEAADARLAIDFFRHFADKCHHGKEEGCLFPALEAKGFPREHGPTGAMRWEHQQGRRHLGAMEAAVPAAAVGVAEAAWRFAAHARAYVDLLRQHIHKEDHRLFPMADATLTPEDEQAVFTSFDQLEHENAGNGTHEKYLRIADDLARRWGVALATAAAGEGGCCRHQDAAHQQWAGNQTEELG
jgi:hemerythrin-like domain-containing protein